MEKDLSAVVAGHFRLNIIPAMPAIPPGGFKETFLPGHLLEVGGGIVSRRGGFQYRIGSPPPGDSRPAHLQDRRYAIEVEIFESGRGVQ
ncbi:MAG TPA: hypothetical protein VII90_01080 [Anaerolineales bacterium]